MKTSASSSFVLKVLVFKLIHFSNEKTRFMVVHNLSDSTINWAPQDSKYKMVMGNYEKTQEGLLHPWESQVYRLDIA